MPDLIHVSITGLRLRRFWHAPRFWMLTVPAMVQARAAEGCLHADARRIDGVHHTRSAWVSREHMLAFLREGAHLRAMQSSRLLGSGRTFGFEALSLPDWPTAIALLRERGRAV